MSDVPIWALYKLAGKPAKAGFLAQAPDAAASDAGASDAKHFKCWLPSNGYSVKATEVVSCSYRVACS